MTTNRSLVDKLVDAVLYEGYILYPYRPSVKNRQRWTFGGLLPRAYSEAVDNNEPWRMQTEFLVRGGPETLVTVSVRFLHLVQRLVEQLDQPATDVLDLERLPSRVVESLKVGDELLSTWQEAEERRVGPESVTLESLVERPRQVVFAFPAMRERTPILDASGLIVGIITRERHEINGEIELNAFLEREGLFRLCLVVRNQTPLPDDPDHEVDRDEALLHGLVSTNAVFSVRDGGFVSLTDPPDDVKAEAASCRNVGAWPVLVGEEGATDTILSAPIILSDYPQIAPESPGDLFDSTEVDEILSLRIMTLTDEEKQAMAAVDQRARAVLDRTESLARDQLMGLHGTIRGLRRVGRGDDRG